MTKEEILKEFADKITDYGFNSEYGYYNDWYDGVMPIVEKYANIIIDQTREETTMEILLELKEMRKFEKYYDKPFLTMNEINRILNKLKK